MDEKLRTANDFVDVGKYRRAISIYSCIIRSQPENPHLFALRGYANYRAGDFHDAIADFDLAVLLKPDVPNTLFLRGKCKENIDDLEGAIEDYRRVIEIAPQTADAHSAIAMIYEFLGRIGEAETEHRNALLVNPDLESSKGFFDRRRT